MNVYRKIEEGEMRIQMVGHTIQCVFYRKLKTGVGQIRLMLLLLLLCVCTCLLLFHCFFLSYSLNFSLFRFGAFTFVKLWKFLRFCLHQFYIPVVLYTIFKLQHPNCNWQLNEIMASVRGLFFLSVSFLRSLILYAILTARYSL